MTLFLLLFLKGNSLSYTFRRERWAKVASFLQDSRVPCFVFIIKWLKIWPLVFWQLPLCSCHCFLSGLLWLPTVSVLPALVPTLSPSCLVQGLVVGEDSNLSLLRVCRPTPSRLFPQLQPCPQPPCPLSLPTLASFISAVILNGLPRFPGGPDGDLGLLKGSASR